MEASDSTLISEPSEPSKDTSSLSIASLPTLRPFQPAPSLAARLETPPVLLFLAVLTVYTVLSDDIRLLCTDKRADRYFFIVALMCFVLFSADLSLSLVFKPEYRGSFYSLLDLLSALSLLPDIDWLWNPIIGLEDTDVSGLNSPATQLSETSHSSVRLSHLLRFTRCIRLVRLSKLYKSTSAALRKESANLQEIRVCRALTEVTMKRMIGVVLLLVMTLPLMELDTFVMQETSFEYGVKMMWQRQGTPQYEFCVEKYIEYHKNSQTPLIYLSISQGQVRENWLCSTNPDSLRLSEKYFTVYEGNVAIFDLRSSTRLAAALSLAQTGLIALILALAAASFDRDITRFAIQPLAQMIATIKNLANDPFSSISHSDTKHSHYEMSLISDAIRQIGSLLAISFGEAGRAILADNLSHAQTLNIMSPGKRVNAIFGFCDIRNFTDVTEVLQEGVMTFVNEVAVIVHSLVDQLLGSANKNIGDAFLIVWKYSDLTAVTPNHLADLSLLACLKILLTVETHVTMEKYRKHRELQGRLPGFQVKLGCGVHAGWAIEGAIGSELKVDASYLSPNVNLASRLEAATKQYGTPLLISETVYQLLSSQVKAACRLIDRVMVKGSGTVLRLFTCDLETKGAEMYSKSMRNRAESREKREEILRNLNKGMFPGAIFLKSKRVRQMRMMETTNFPAVFKQGVSSYLAGQWEKARISLNRAAAIRPKDGPSKAILAYMTSQDFLPPKEWKGYRTLLEK